MRSRYEGKLLTMEQSRALISKMDKWCRRTGTNYNKLVGLARVSPSLRSSVRTRNRPITIKLAERINDVMIKNKYGIKEVNYHGKITPEMAAEIVKASQIIELRRVNRDPCFHCGVPVDRGCSHTILNR